MANAGGDRIGTSFLSYYFLYILCYGSCEMLKGLFVVFVGRKFTGITHLLQWDLERNFTNQRCFESELHDTIAVCALFSHYLCMRGNVCTTTSMVN